MELNSRVVQTFVGRDAVREIGEVAVGRGKGGRERGEVKWSFYCLGFRTICSSVQPIYNHV